MKCHAIMKPNMNRPQRNAMTIQINSTFSIRSFHQIRSLGGVMAILVPVFVFASPERPQSFCKRDGGDLHHAPEDVEHCRYRDAEKKQQERIIENPLHRGNA